MGRVAGLGVRRVRCVAGDSDSEEASNREENWAVKQTRKAATLMGDEGEKKDDVEPAFILFVCQAR